MTRYPPLGRPLTRLTAVECHRVGLSLVALDEFNGFGWLEIPPSETDIRVLATVE